MNEKINNYFLGITTQDKTNHAKAIRKTRQRTEYMLNKLAFKLQEIR